MHLPGEQLGPQKGCKNTMLIDLANAGARTNQRISAELHRNLNEESVHAWTEAMHACNLRSTKRKSAASVSIAIEKLASHFGYRQVLEIRAGTQPYLKLWHSALDGVFDFKSAWVTRKHDEAKKEEERKGNAEVLQKTANRNAANRQPKYLNDDRADSPTDSEEEAGALPEKSGSKADNVNETEGQNGGMFATLRSAMVSWEVFCMRLLESEQTQSNTPKHPQKHSRPLSLMQNSSLSSHRRNMVGVDDKDFGRAHAKVKEFCEQRNQESRRLLKLMKGVKKGEGTRKHPQLFRSGSLDKLLNCPSSSDGQLASLVPGHWSALTLEDTLDMLQCAELVLEDSITDPMLCVLSSHEPPAETDSFGERALKRSANLFLETDYKDVVHARQMATRDALQVITTLHQHILWKLPTPSKENSKHVTQMEYWNWNETCEHATDETHTGRRRAKSMEELILEAWQCGSEGQQAYDIANAIDDLLNYLAIKQTEEEEERKENKEEPRKDEVRGKVQDTEDTKKVASIGSSVDGHLKRRSVVSQKDEMKILVARKDELQGELRTSQASMNAPAPKPLEGGESAASQKGKLEGGGSPASQKGKHNEDDPELVSLEFGLLRESKMSLLLRFPDMHMTILSRDALHLNEDIQVAALISYSDVLRARALSLLRRLAALRSRIKLQMEIHKEQDLVDVHRCSSDANILSRTASDSVNADAPNQEGTRKTMRLEREEKNLREIEDFAVDAFRKNDLSLQVNEIQHEIDKQFLSLAEGQATDSMQYIDRILDVFITNVWSRRLSLPVDSLGVQEKTIQYLTNAFPKCHQGSKYHKLQSSMNKALHVSKESKENERLLRRNLIMGSNDAPPIEDKGYFASSQGARRHRQQEMEEKGEEERAALEREFGWAVLSARGLVNLGCLAVLLRNFSNIQQVDRAQLLLFLEGVLKFTLYSKTGQRLPSHTKSPSTVVGSRHSITEFTDSIKQTRSKRKTAAAEFRGPKGIAIKKDPVCDKTTEEESFILVFIRVYSNVNHLVRDRGCAVRLRNCGFVDVALMLLGHKDTKWGLGEELLAFLCIMTQIHGGRLFGCLKTKIKSSDLLDEFFRLNVEWDHDPSDQDCNDRSKEAVPIIVMSLRKFGVKTLPTDKIAGRQRKSSGDMTSFISRDDAIDESETSMGVSVRATGEGLHVLMMLAMQEAATIVEHGGLLFATIAMRTYREHAPIQLVGTRLCLRLLAAQDHAREISVLNGFHHLLIDNLGRHAAECDVVEFAMYGLKMLTFASPKVRAEVLARKPLTLIAQVWRMHRVKDGVVAAGLSLLCNLARSKECCNAIVGSEVLDLVVANMLQHQENAEVVKSGAWTIFNLLVQKSAPYQRIEQALSATFPAILVHIMNKHSHLAAVQAACCALAAALSRTITSFHAALKLMGAHEAVSAAMLTHKRDSALGNWPMLALKMLTPDALSKMDTISDSYSTMSRRSDESFDALIAAKSFL